MNLQTFHAATMAEALSRVKSTMGNDAVILHTRTFQRRQWLGLRRREVVEITAGRRMRVAATRNNTTVAATATRSEARSAALPASPRPASNIPGRQLLESPAGQSAAMLGLQQEMCSLKTMVKDLVTHARQRDCPQVPEDLFEYYLRLIESQVADELATEVIRALHKQLRPEQFTQPQIVQERLAELLEKMIPAAGPLRRTKAVGPHIVAFIGPTGVGKTTTIAKLAANLNLREKRRVGLITIDTYRIAAIEQLKKYSDILNAPLKIVATPEEMREAVRALSNCEFILIDTAGRSPNDALKLSELRQMLEAAKPDEVHLVLSSTASQACVDLAVQRFGDVRVDKILFTKIDEAAHLGVVLNVVTKVNKSLSYVTTGQDVPDDIEVGQGRRLAKLMLGGTP